MWRSLLVCALVLCVCAQRWEEENRAFAAIAMGIAQGDRNRVYVGAFRNGQGARQYWSENNGETYESQELENGPFLYAAAAAVGSQAVTAGHTAGILTGIHITTNGGATWRPQPDLMEFFVSTTQSCSATPGRQNERFAWFGCVGTFPGGQDGIMRVVFTDDNGATWSRSPTIAPRIRYGAYPTRDTWYVTGGTWPNAGKQGEGVVELGWGLNIHTKSHNGTAAAARMEFQHGHDLSARLEADPKDFTAFVWKTSNRGQTWTRVFNRVGEGYYPQYIDCVTDRLCWFAAEGTAGALVFHTNDGGATWTEQLRVPNTPTNGFNFYPIVMLNEREGWVAGARLGFPTMMGIFYRTLDGGRTWNLQSEVPGMMINSMDIKALPGGGLAGHATAVTFPEQQSGTAVLRG